MVCIASYNVNGLNDEISRKRVFNWAKSENLDILCLQEIHCEGESKGDKWATEWGNRDSVFLSNLTSKSAGVGIFLNPDKEIDIVEPPVEISKGRIQLISLRIRELKDRVLNVVNVYAQNVPSQRSELV